MPATTAGRPSTDTICPAQRAGDSDDQIPGPFLLPDCVREGDYIEIGQIGAYGRVMATRFNGFGEYDEVMLTDEPMLSMYAGHEQQHQLKVLETARNDREADSLSPYN